VKPKAEGMLTIEGVAFDLRPVNVEPSAAVVGLVSSVSGKFTSILCWLIFVKFKLKFCFRASNV
jgi:hypothetical protein